MQFNLTSCGQSTGRVGRLYSPAARKKFLFVDNISILRTNLKKQFNPIFIDQFIQVIKKLEIAFTSWQMVYWLGSLSHWFGSCIHIYIRLLSVSSLFVMSLMMITPRSSYSLVPL